MILPSDRFFLLLTSLVPSQGWVNTFIPMVSDAAVIAKGSYSCTNGSEDNRNHMMHGHVEVPSPPHICLGPDILQDFFSSSSPPIITIKVTQNNGLCTTAGYHFRSSPRKDPLPGRDSPTFSITSFLEETCYEERFSLKPSMDSLLQGDH